MLIMIFNIFIWIWMKSISWLLLLLLSIMSVLNDVEFVKWLMNWRMLFWLMLNWINCRWSWSTDSMLKIDIELTRKTKKSNVVENENDEFWKVELLKTEIIDEKINSRRFEMKNWDRKRCDLKTNDSIEEKLFEFCCRDLKLKKKVARKTTIFRIKRSITRRRNALIKNQSTKYDDRN